MRSKLHREANNLLDFANINTGIILLVKIFKNSLLRLRRDTHTMKDNISIVEKNNSNSKDSK